MNDELFGELLESVREGSAILRGEQTPARAFEMDTLNIKQIRDRFELSKYQFAALLGISEDTLQNWEQSRRKPRGAARVLLQVAEKHPDVVWDVTRSTLVNV